MRRKYSFWIVLLFLTGEFDQIGTNSWAEDREAVKTAALARLEGELGSLVELYKDLHQNPELSFAEVRTAARMAQELRRLNFAVTEKVGGHGVVGVLRNGSGPTIMIRTDLDALPVVEQTGLPYASQVRVRDGDGQEVGVMHACGHDIHMTCWVGTARMLVALKDRWRGTLVFIGQPAEERGAGAKAMLEDGLFSRFPKPDYALALHADGSLPHGQIGFTEGMALANVDSVDIVVRGVGGHGSMPHTTIDPVVIAARIVLDLQTIVSRELDPLDSAVVTVGSIHGGSKHNIIPSEVKLQLTVRTFKDSVRKHVLEAIERKAKAAAAAARAPEPMVKMLPGEFTPSTYNDPKLTQRVVASLRPILGSENVVTKPPAMGGEDFSRFGRAGVPIFIFWLGTVAPEKVEQARRTGQPLPSLHSPFFAPVPEPTIRTGVMAMTFAALELLASP
jgi:hippurate hydrolase